MTEAYTRHVRDLAFLAECGDVIAAKSLAALALLNDGWRPGDPDPTDTPPGGGELIDLNEWRVKRAA